VQIPKFTSLITNPQLHINKNAFSFIINSDKKEQQMNSWF